MKKHHLQPSQLLTHHEDGNIGNEDMLRVYLRWAQSHTALSFPPVIVANPSLSDRRKLARRTAETIEGQLGEYFLYVDAYRAMGAAWYLLDGNHRALAAALCHQPIPAFELESDRDIGELRAMLDRGEVISIPGGFDEESLSERVTAFDWEGLHLEIIMINGLDHHQYNLQTVEEKIDMMVRKERLPQFMIDLYQKK